MPPTLFGAKQKLLSVSNHKHFFQKHSISSHLKCLPHFLFKTDNAFFWKNTINFYFQKHTMSSHRKCLPHFLAQNKHVLLFKNTSDFSFQKHKISSHLKCLPHCLVQNRQSYLFQSTSNFSFQKHKNIILPKIPPTLFGSKQTMLSFFKEHTLFLCKSTKCPLT